MIIYSQRDPQWKSKKLGFGTGTIGMYGCKVTALAQGLLRFNINYTPDALNTILKDYKLFVGATENLLDDANITKLPFITSFRRVDNWDGDLTELANLLKTHVVIGEVSPVPIGGSGQHFVGVDSIDGKNAVITDPWFGDKIRVAARYNNYENILGLRIYQVKSTSEAMPDKYPYGIDLNNPESVKVCVETWKQVIDKEYVKASEVAQKDALYEETINDLRKKLTAETEALKDSKNKYSTFVERCAELVGSPKDEESLIKFLSNYNQALEELDEYKIKYDKQAKQLTEEKKAYQEEINGLLERMSEMEKAQKQAIEDLQEKHSKEISKLKQEITDIKNDVSDTATKEKQLSEIGKVFQYLIGLFKR